MNEMIDKCRADTLNHIRDVDSNIKIFITELIRRGNEHDLSKLESPELEIFAEADELGKVQYGSIEYKNNLEKIKPAISHHYSRNRHHPEH